MSIDNDDYFALMMNNSWNLKGDAQTYQKYDKCWAKKDDEDNKPKQWRDPPKPVLRSGQASRDNPLVNTHDYYKSVTTASRGNASTAMYAGPPMEKEKIVQQNKNLQKQVV